MPFHSLDRRMLPVSHRDAALATLTESQQEQMWTVALPALWQNPLPSSAQGITQLPEVSAQPQPIPGMAPGLSSQLSGSS